MTGELTIVGGTYAETCREPSWHEIFGSGGRAACSINSEVAGCKVRLITPAIGKHKNHIEMLARSYGFSVDTLSTDRLFRFNYLHPMHPPTIAESAPTGDATKLLPLEAECALVFGLLEGVVPVSAKRIVYDPQSPSAPLTPEDAGLKCDSLAVICNQTEARKLGGEGVSCFQLANSLRDKLNASVVVVKSGPRGATVAHEGGVSIVPPLPTTKVFSIGSGDVFSARFAVEWGVGQKDPIEAAREASRATAEYVESTVLPTLNGGKHPLPTVQQTDSPLAITGQVYLAGPFFNEGERWLVEELRDTLRGAGLKVFSPLHDVGRGKTGRVVPADVQAIHDSKVMLAILHNCDPGTIYEVGYARALNMPVVGLCNDTGGEALKMLRGTNCELRTEIASAVYATAWALAAIQ